MNRAGFEEYGSGAITATSVPYWERDLWRVKHRLDDIEFGARVAIELDHENKLFGRRRIAGVWI